MQNPTPRTNLLINLFEEMKTKYIGMPLVYSYDIQNPNAPGGVSEPLTEKLIQHYIQRLNGLLRTVYGLETREQKQTAAAGESDTGNTGALDAMVNEMVDIINLLFHPTLVTLSRTSSGLTYSIDDSEYTKYRIHPHDVITMRIHESPQTRCSFLTDPKTWFQCGLDTQDFNYMKIDKDLGIGPFEFWMKDLEINRKLHDTLTGLNPSYASLSGVLFSQKPTDPFQGFKSSKENGVFMITTNKIIIGNTFLVIDHVTKPINSLLPCVKIRTIQLDRPVVHFSFLQLNTNTKEKHGSHLTPHSHLNSTYCIPLRTFYKFIDHFMNPIEHK